MPKIAAHYDVVWAHYLPSKDKGFTIPSTITNHPTNLIIPVTETIKQSMLKKKHSFN